MIQSINQLKQWFIRHKYPTQQQFWDWLDSYWHKNENIPASSIDGLQEVFNGITNGIGEALDAKQDKKDDNLETNSKEVVGAINEVNKLALGQHNYNILSSDDSIDIAHDIYTVTNDSITIINEVFALSVAETIQRIEDNALKTDSKEVVGAINEIYKIVSNIGYLPPANRVIRQDASTSYVEHDLSPILDNNASVQSVVDAFAASTAELGIPMSIVATESAMLYQPAPSGYIRGLGFLKPIEANSTFTAELQIKNLNENNIIEDIQIYVRTSGNQAFSYSVDGGTFNPISYTAGTDMLVTLQNINAKKSIVFRKIAGNATTGNSFLTFWNIWTKTKVVPEIEMPTTGIEGEIIIFKPVFGNDILYKFVDNAYVEIPVSIGQSIRVINENLYLYVFDGTRFDDWDHKVFGDIDSIGAQTNNNSNNIQSMIAQLSQQGIVINL